MIPSSCVINTSIVAKMRKQHYIYLHHFFVILLKYFLAYFLQLIQIKPRWHALSRMIYICHSNISLGVKICRSLRKMIWNEKNAASLYILMLSPRIIVLSIYDYCILHVILYTYIYLYKNIIVKLFFLSTYIVYMYL